METDQSRRQCWEWTNSSGGEDIPMAPARNAVVGASGTHMAIAGDNLGEGPGGRVCLAVVACGVPKPDSG